MSSPCPCKKVTPVLKLGYSALGAGIFFVLSLPWTYRLLNSLVASHKTVLVNSVGTPTVLGVVIHAVVFMLIMFLIMQPWKTTSSCECDMTKR